MKTLSPAYVLWDANVRARSFQDKVLAAAAGGFSVLTVPIRVYRQELEAGRSAAQMVSAASDAGVTLDFLDGMSGWAPIRCPASAQPWLRGALANLDVSPVECLDICEALGIKTIVAVGAFDDGELTVPQIVESFAALCDLAKPRGIGIDLEFLAMLGIGSLADAWEIIQQADKPNGRILLDTWHFMRKDPDFDLLRKIPADRIINVQLADAVKEVKGSNLWDDAHRFRLAPGDGELPMVQILEVLNDKRSLRSLGPESFSDQLSALSAEQVGRELGAKTARVAQAAGIDSASKHSIN